MPLPPQQAVLPPAIRNVLNTVRRRIRTYVWLQGVAAILIFAGLAFWALLGLDRFFEPSPAIRKFGLVITAVAGCYVAWRYLLRRMAVPISDSSAAVLLERRFPSLQEHVLTAVDFAARPDAAETYNAQLVRDTQESAVAAIARVRPQELFKRGPLVRSLIGAFAAVLSIGAFAIFAHESFGFWLERLAMSEKPWPRRVHLEVVGFPPDDSGVRTAKLAQDDDFELLVHANTQGYEVPDQVEIRFRLADGRYGRDTMIRVGEAVASNQDHQLFRYQFKRVASDLQFDIVGGDDRVRDLHLQVVERPELFDIEVECVYPAYLQRESRLLPVTGGMRIPEGTRLVLHAGSTKPLVSANIRHANPEDSSKPAEAKLDFSDKARKDLSWEYGPLRADDVLFVNATDTDGVSARDPYRISLAVVPDESPEVAARLSGIGSAVTPDAVLPFVGKVTDDYGLGDVWLEYQVEGGTPVSYPLAAQPNGEPLLETLGDFDLRGLDPRTGQRALLLTPGQRLSIAIKAADRYDLSDTPHVGSSQQFVLEIVTPSDLLALLERRELSLRQRYEAIFEKMTDTRNLLARVEFGNEPKDGQTGDSEDNEPESPERVQARRQLRVTGAQQNVVQSRDEVAGIAAGFDDLGEELTNNRIDNTDLKNRLREQIAVPMHRIAKELMPELLAQVKLLQENVKDPAKGQPELVKSLAMTDTVLVEMKKILDRMLELETYNEVVNLLRDIIRDQDEINRETKERQKERLRSLFDEE